jgi:hypothetical protein
VQRSGSSGRKALGDKSLVLGDRDGYVLALDPGCADRPAAAPARLMA